MWRVLVCVRNSSRPTCRRRCASTCSRKRTASRRLWAESARSEAPGLRPIRRGREIQGRRARGARALLARWAFAGRAPRRPHAGQAPLAHARRRRGDDGGDCDWRHDVRSHQRPPRSDVTVPARGSRRRGEIRGGENRRGRPPRAPCVQRVARSPHHARTDRRVSHRAAQLRGARHAARADQGGRDHGVGLRRGANPAAARPLSAPFGRTRRQRRRLS